MRRSLYMSVLLILTVTGARAQMWTNTTANGNWSASTNWTPGVPTTGGTADVVLTNATGTGTINSIVDTAWAAAGSINSLVFAGSSTLTTGRIDLYNSGGALLGIGSGGIGWTGTNALTQMFAPINFVTATSVIYQTHAGAPAALNTYGNWTSSNAGGTTVRWIADSVKNGGALYFQGGYTVGANIKSDANVRWEHHNGGMYLAQTNGLTALGTNKLYIGRESRAITRELGLLLTDNRNLNLQDGHAHAYFDTPLEFNAALNTYANRFQINVDARILGYNGGAVVTTNYTTHIRGAWSTLGGTNLDAQGDGGVIWLYGNTDHRVKTYMEADNSSFKSLAKMGTSSNSAIYIRSGWYVANAPHAFGTNNSLLVRLAEANSNGGTTNRAYLATSGNHVSGEVVLWGGGGTNNGVSVVPLNAFMGLEGEGAVEFSGNIWMTRRADATAWQVHNMYLTAPSNGTLTVSGKIQDTGAGFVRGLNITGGGTVVLENINIYTNRTTVMSNTTLRLDGSLASEIEVLSGSVLKGGGAANANVIISGDFAPGASIGTFTAYADVDFLSGSTFTIELGPGNTSDLLDVIGDLDITGATLRLVGNDVGTFTIATYGTRTGGAFALVDTTGLGDGYTLDSLAYGTGSGDAITLTVIPEPASILLLVSGLVGAYKLRRRS